MTQQSYITSVVRAHCRKQAAAAHQAKLLDIVLLRQGKELMVGSVNKCVGVDEVEELWKMK